MKTNFLILSFTAALFTFAAANMHASLVPLRFDTLPTNTNDGTYNGFVGVTASGTTSISLICDDFMHTTYVPSGPTPFNLSTLTDLSDTRFNSQTMYEQASLLLYGDGQSNLKGLVNDTPNTSAYQYALWNLMEPGAAASEGYSDPGAAALVTTVKSVDLTNPNFQTLFSDLRIYTPINNGTDQEFLGFVAGTVAPTDPGLLGFHTGITATPEPGTWGMSMGVLAVAAMIGRKRFARSAR